MLLLHAEFAHNKAPSKATNLSPFKVVYGIDPLSPVWIQLNKEHFTSAKSTSLKLEAIGISEGKNFEG